MGKAAWGGWPVLGDWAAPVKSLVHSGAMETAREPGMAHALKWWFWWKTEGGYPTELCTEAHLTENGGLGKQGEGQTWKV